MCGRFYVDDDTLDEIEKTIRKVDEKIREQKMNKDIYPTDEAPVIVASGKELILARKRWGYPGFQKKGVIFNARSETVQQKPLFGRGIAIQRAIIPATHFYEWNKEKEKNTFSRIDGKCLYLAGFYDRKEGEDRFVILTTAANASMLPIHDRMPLILEQNQIDEWLLDDEAYTQMLKQQPITLQRTNEYEQQEMRFTK